MNNDARIDAEGAVAGTQVPPAVRKPYAAPKLTRFGTIAEITEKATGNADGPGMGGAS